MAKKSHTQAVPYSESEARDLMGRIGWLTRTPEDFRAKMLKRCRLQSFDADQPVYNIGDPPGGLYGLVRGSLAVMTAPNQVGPYISHILGIGGWIGLAAALYRQPRTVGLKATRPSQLLLLPMVEFDNLVAEDPAAWRYFAAMAIIHTNVAMGAADDLLIRDPAKRCIASVLRLAGLRNTLGNSAAVDNLDVTQEELALISNLSRNATGSVLRGLEKRGLVELTYKNIRIVDPGGLAAMMREGEDG